MLRKIFYGFLILICLLIPAYLIWDIEDQKIKQIPHLLHAVPEDTRAIFRINQLQDAANLEIFRYTASDLDSSLLILWNLDAKDLYQMTLSFPALHTWVQEASMLFLERAGGSRIFISQGNVETVKQFEYLVKENPTAFKDIIHFNNAFFWTEGEWIVFASTEKDIDDIRLILQKKQASLMQNPAFEQVYQSVSYRHPANYFFNNEAWESTFWGHQSGIHPQWIAFDIQAGIENHYLLSGFFTTIKTPRFIYNNNLHAFSNFQMPTGFLRKALSFKIFGHQAIDHFLNKYFSPYFLYSKTNEHRFLFFRLEQELGNVPIEADDLKNYLGKRVQNFFGDHSALKLTHFADWVVLGTQYWESDQEDVHPLLDQYQNLSMDYGMAIHLSPRQNRFLDIGQLAGITMQVQKQDSLRYFVNFYLQNRKQPPPKVAEPVRIQKFIPRGFIVQNHQNKKKETFKQAEDGSLSLYDGENQLWNFPFDAQITGNLQQIDWFGNGKLQFFFTAKDKIYLLDRNGKNVAPFPFALQGKADLGAFVWQQGKVLSFLVPVDKKIYYFHKKSAQAIWQTADFEKPIAQLPFVFEQNKKTYIFVLDEAGTVYLLNNQGVLVHRYAKKIPDPREVTALKLRFGTSLQKNRVALTYSNEKTQEIGLD